VQTKLLEKNQCNVLVNQILQNAVVLVQGLRFIENNERFSSNNDIVTDNYYQRSNHVPGYTSFGVDDFQSADNRVTSYLKWFEQNQLKKHANIIFPTLELMSQLMNDRYNGLRNKIPLLSIDRNLVTFQSSRSIKRWSTNIFTPLYHLSPEHKTMPLWVDKSVWKLFFENDYEFDIRGFHKSINETPNDSEKNLYAAIEITKTGDELNYETVLTTKAVMTKSQTEHEKKMKLIKGKNRLKKGNEGGEKTDNSDNKFVIVEKKVVQKTNSSNDYFEENKLATSEDDFEKKISSWKQK
jgi:hypothetical protein